MRGRRSDLWAGHGAVQREGPVIQLAETDSSAMRNERIEVRRATTSDAADIAPLYLHFLQSYGHAAERSAVVRFLADLLPEPWVLFFVAIDAPKKVVGFTGCVLTYSAVSQALALTINDMFVAASARRRGSTRPNRPPMRWCSSTSPSAHTRACFSACAVMNRSSRIHSAVPPLR